MDTIPTKILAFLGKKQMKPGEISKALGISRQALHGYVRLLLEAKRIEKNGAGPHVRYSAPLPPSRVLEDYKLCRQELLPRYLKEFSGTLQHSIEHLGDQKSTTMEGKLDPSFLLDCAAVYSSNIEGNTLDLNSFLNSRMSPKKHRPKEAQEIEDLVSAYEYARKNDLNEKHMLHAHKILSKEFVATSRQGNYRQEPVGVFSRFGLVYMAVEPYQVGQEMRALFTIIAELLGGKPSPAESFFWAAWLHLMIALIHPFSDGNGRTARLCEKWFLASQLGEQSFAFQSEELYWKNRPEYYAALKLGVNYWETDMRKAFPFFALLPQALTVDERVS